MKTTAEPGKTNSQGILNHLGAPIPDKMFFKIGEVARIVGVKPYVLRYWETEFSVIAPQKTNSQQRLYSRVDVENILLIRQLLYGERFSIEGARKRIAEIKKSGALGEARRPKLTLDAGVIAEVRGLVRSLMELCQIEH